MQRNTRTFLHHTSRNDRTTAAQHRAAKTCMRVHKEEEGKIVEPNKQTQQQQQQQEQRQQQNTRENRCEAEQDQLRRHDLQKQGTEMKSRQVTKTNGNEKQTRQKQKTPITASQRRKDTKARMLLTIHSPHFSVPLNTYHYVLNSYEFGS